MLAIRLSRVGRKKLPQYRVIVQEHKFAPSGKFVDQVGHYDPRTKETVLDKEKIEKHLSNGAQPSNRVAKLLKQEGVKLPEWVQIVERKRAPKTKDDGDAEAAPAKEEKADKAEDKDKDASEEKAEKKEDKEDKSADKADDKKEEKADSDKEEAADKGSKEAEKKSDKKNDQKSDDK